MLPVLKEDIVNCNKAVMASSFVSELKGSARNIFLTKRNGRKII